MNMAPGTEALTEGTWDQGQRFPSLEGTYEPGSQKGSDIIQRTPPPLWTE